MEFKDILSISGMPGLYELVSTKSNGIIVKSLEDGKSQFVSSRIQGVSALENISVYLKGDETTSLKKVLCDMQEKESANVLPDAKSDPEILKEYFKTVVPEYDAEKVHVSDMKKMVRWYHILKEHDLIPAKEEEPSDLKTEGSVEEPAAEIKENETEITEEQEKVKKAPRKKKEQSDSKPESR